MRKQLFIIALLIVPLVSISQETLILNNGDRIQGKVTGSDSSNIYIDMMTDGNTTHTYVNKNEIVKLYDTYTKEPIVFRNFIEATIYIRDVAMLYDNGTWKYAFISKNDTAIAAKTNDHRSVVLYKNGVWKYGELKVKGRKGQTQKVNDSITYNFPLKQATINMKEPVLLNDDGTWKYEYASKDSIKIARTSDKRLVTLFGNGTWKYAEISDKERRKEKRDTTNFKNIIKVAPIGFLGGSGSYAVSFERKLDKRNSIDFYAGYKQNNSNSLALMWYNDDDEYTWKISGFMVDVGYRYYFSQKKKRFYISRNFRYCSLNEKTYWYRDGTLDDNSNISSFATSIVVGYEATAGRFTTDVFIGPQLKTINGFPSNGVVIPWEDYSQIPILSNLIRFGFNLGFAF